MVLKKFYGTSIEKARQKAQRSLGQTYIVVETKEGNAEEPAWIHVLDEEKNNSDASKKSGTYSRRDLFPKAISKLRETVNDSFQFFNRDGLKTGVDKSHSVDDSKRAPKDERFLPYRKFAGLTDEKPSQPETTPANRAVHPNIDALSKRFDRLEALVSKQMVTANAEFVSHPAFQQLLANGIPYTMISGWFSQLIAQGADPFDREGRFTQLLAQKMRKILDVAASEPPAKFMIFSGSAGSGKSSLIMKLALNEDFFGAASCALISVVPGDVKNHYPSLAAFASEHDFLHFRIGIQPEWDQLREELGSFDHVLIEMPAEERQTTPSGFSAPMLTQAISQSGSTEVHHVVNAALNPAALQRLPYETMAGDYMDFTHLDVASKQGQLLPLMAASGCRIRYTSAGLKIPESIARFKPTHFARQLLSNA